MVDLPEVMPAAVYRRPGEVVVEETAGAPARCRARYWWRPTTAGSAARTSICCSRDGATIRGWLPDTSSPGPIVALGEGVEGWEIGETVVGGPSPKCGRCRRCLEGKPSQCENRQGSIVDGHDGAFARYVLVRAVSLLRLPPGLTARQAALAEPLAVALHGITRSGVSVGDTVMVIGAGPIGALSIAALVARGIGPVIAVEPGERRKELALESRRLRGARPRRPRGVPSMGARADLRARRARGARVLGQEGGHGGRVPPAAAGAAPWPWWGPASSIRRSTPTGSSSTSSTWWVRSSTTRADSSRRSNCWPPTGFRPTC